MTQVALVVEFRIVESRRDEFLALIGEHARRTSAEEPGCVQFDVLEPFAVQNLDGSVVDADVDAVRLYEVYRDENAFATHLDSPLLPTLRAAYRDMVRERRIIRCHVRGS
ncbi:MAG: antibiotic biosynthesis monooxygenase [Nitriliruptoraceae bacterium]